MAYIIRVKRIDHKGYNQRPINQRRRDIIAVIKYRHIYISRIERERDPLKERSREYAGEKKLMASSHLHITRPYKVFLPSLIYIITRVARWPYSRRELSTFQKASALMAFKWDVYTKVKKKITRAFVLNYEKQGSTKRKRESEISGVSRVFYIITHTSFRSNCDFWCDAHRKQHWKGLCHTSSGFG